MSATLDPLAFVASRPFQINGVEYRLGWANGRASLTEKRGGAAPQSYPIDFVLGYTPLHQYVVPIGNGRYQATELAFDPRRREWFNVFGSDVRHAGEWGYWLGRGMNWNSMCAHCHMTEYAKTYDSTTDSYASTWLEHGVGCIQCHGDLSVDHERQGYKTLRSRRQDMANASRAQETCAPCHARNELLTGEPRPGMVYSDHFRLTLPINRATFYPDGQVRDEDFNWTSLLTSRMGGKAGVTCLDCHDPHSGQTRLPVTNNALCLQCHAGPNSRNAPVIDPTAHSHHPLGSAGNECVACHMPTTTYMQRDARHDHGFLKPDPLLTRELGIPNACGRCHADRGVDWEIAAADKWYGANLDSRQRQRARAVDAAEKGLADSPNRVLPLIATEDVPAWRAAMLQLLRAWADAPEVSKTAVAALSDPSPLVRSAAVELLASGQGHLDQIRPALRDPSRLVRIDAETVLTAELPSDSAARKELDGYFAVSADQPSGKLRRGEDLATRGQMAEATRCLRTAVTWDPESAGTHEAYGLLLNRAGDSQGGAAELWRGAQLDETNATIAFEAGLAFAAAGKPSEAETAMRETVRRDPALHRGWYNLGLMLAQTNRPQEAIAALTRAETIAPNVADYPYARATILWQKGDRAEAVQAARRALQIDGRFQPAKDLLSAAPGQ